LLGCGEGVSRASKKNLTDDLIAYSEGAPVENPNIRSLRIARLCNQLHGGPVVTMWDVGEMDDVTVDFLLAMAIQYPEMQRVSQENEQRRMSWLRSHSSYGKFGLLVN
jgi:hypothetical protein